MKARKTFSSRRTVATRTQKSMEEQTIEACLKADEEPHAGVLAGFLSPEQMGALRRRGQFGGVDPEKAGAGRPPINPEALSAAQTMYGEVLPWTRWLLRVWKRHPEEGLWDAVQAQWRQPGKPASPRPRLPYRSSENRQIRLTPAFTCEELARFLEPKLPEPHEARFAETAAAQFVCSKLRAVLGDRKIHYSDLCRKGNKPQPPKL